MPLPQSGSDMVNRVKSRAFAAIDFGLRNNGRKPNNIAGAIQYNSSKPIGKKALPILTLQQKLNNLVFSLSSASTYFNTINQLLSNQPIPTIVTTVVTPELRSYFLQKNIDLTTGTSILNLATTNQNGVQVFDIAQIEQINPGTNHYIYFSDDKPIKIGNTTIEIVVNLSSNKLRVTLDTGTSTTYEFGDEITIEGEKFQFLGSGSGGLFIYLGTNYGIVNNNTEISLSTQPSIYNNLDGITLDSADNIYIADYGNNKILKYNSTGNLISSYYGFNNPKGIAIDSANNIYVTNYNNNSIYKLDTNGVISMFYNDGLDKPYGIHIKNGYMYIANNTKISKIEINNISNKTELSFSGQFDGLRGITLDNNNNIYVVSSGGNEPTIYKSINNQVTFEIFYSFVLPFRPNGITFKSFDATSNIIFITDYASGNVFSFDLSQTIKPLKNYLCYSSLSNPLSIIISNDGNTAYVLNGTSSNIILKFNINKIVIQPARQMNLFSSFSNNLGSVFGIAVDPRGNVYVASRSFSNIYKLTPNITRTKYELTLLAGNGRYGYQDGIGSNALFNVPAGVCWDEPRKCLYVCDDFANNRIRKITSDGVVTTIAGDGAKRISLSSFWDPQGINIDSSGNLYVLQQGTQSIIKLTPPPISSPPNSLWTQEWYAGNDIRQTTPLRYRDGTGTFARLCNPISMICDPITNDIIVADNGNDCIRKVTVPGKVVSTIAGDVNRRGNSDNINGILASFSGPFGIYDYKDGYLVSDAGNNSIRKISKQFPHAVETWTINQSSNIGFKQISYVAVDQLGGFYIADASPSGGVFIGNYVSNPGEVNIQLSNMDTFISYNNTNYIDYKQGFLLSNDGFIYIGGPKTVKKYNNSSTNYEIISNNDFDNVNAIIQTPAGNRRIFLSCGNKTIYYHDNNNSITILASGLNNPNGGITVDSTNTIYYTSADNTISSISNTGYLNTSPLIFKDLNLNNPTEILLTETSTEKNFYILNGGFFPTSVVVDSDGNSYIVDSNNNNIRKVTSTGIISTLLDKGSSVYFTEEPKYFINPTGLCIDSDDNIYISDSGNKRICKLTFINGNLTTISRVLSPGITFDNPTCICVDLNNNIYVADSGSHKIIRIQTINNSASIIAGSIQGFNDGIGSIAKFNNPRGIVFDSASGSLYLADTDNHRIRKIDLTNNQVSTIAGNGQPALNNDSISSFNKPYGLTIASNGDIYVGDSGNNCIRKIVLTSTTITTSTFLSISVPGSSDPIPSGFLDGPNPLFNCPTEIFIDTNNNLFIVDSLNNSVRKVTNNFSNTITIAGENSITKVKIDNINTIPIVYIYNDFIPLLPPKIKLLAIDSVTDNIYTVDKRNNSICKINLSTKDVTINHYTLSSTDLIITDITIKNRILYILTNLNKYYSFNLTVAPLQIERELASTQIGTSPSNINLTTTQPIQIPAGTEYINFVLVGGGGGGGVNKEGGGSGAQLKLRIKKTNDIVSFRYNVGKGGDIAYNGNNTTISLYKNSQGTIDSITGLNNCLKSFGGENGQSNNGLGGKFSSSSNIINSSVQSLLDTAGITIELTGTLNGVNSLKSTDNYNGIGGDLNWNIYLTPISVLNANFKKIGSASSSDNFDLGLDPPGKGGDFAMPGNDGLVAWFFEGPSQYTDVTLDPIFKVPKSLMNQNFDTNWFTFLYSSSNSGIYNLNIPDNIFKVEVAMIGGGAYNGYPGQYIRRIINIPFVSAIKKLEIIVGRSGLLNANGGDSSVQITFDPSNIPNILPIVSQGGGYDINSDQRRFVYPTSNFVTGWQMGYGASGSNGCVMIKFS